MTCEICDKETIITYVGKSICLDCMLEIEKLKDQIKKECNKDVQ